MTSQTHVAPEESRADVALLPLESPASDAPQTDERPAATRDSRPFEAPSKREILTVVGAGLTIFGIAVLSFAVYLLGISRLEHGRDQRSLMQQFDQLVETQSAPIGGRIDEGTPIGVIEIPAIDQREAVVEGTSGTELKQGPGHLRTSPLPGQAGNAVIACRRIAYGGPCYHLGSLEHGDEINVVTGQGESRYVVTGIRLIARGDDDVLVDAGDNRLTLVTSSRFFARERVAVIAELQDDPFVAPDGRPTELRPAELGLHRDGANVVALVLWLQLLLVASIATAWLLRRHGRWPAYLVTAPVIALLVLLVFDCFTPLLPSTL